jgi:hypothetical protein
MSAGRGFPYLCDKYFDKIGTLRFFVKLESNMLIIERTISKSKRIKEAIGGQT